ncbi:MAG: SDR family NAD(P)-dependent oxidoreductase [Alphaproteobacteria bacterium]
MARLAGRVALITGGAWGIGRAAAQVFAREGAKVAIADIDEAAGAALARDLGAGALFVPTDVTDEASVKAAVAEIEKKFGRLDTLFNCAGGSVSEDAPLGKVDVATVWDKTMRLDLLGTINCCHHGIPAMVRAGGGAVVNMSSGAALRGASPAHIYTAAKGGIVSLTRALAGTYAEDNVRVNAICAGRILTERILARYGAPDAPKPAEDQQADARVKEYPFWVGNPEDIANVALFLASDESRMITGAAIPADGGRSAY